MVSSFTPTKHLHLRRAWSSLSLVWTSCYLLLVNVASCFWVNLLKCDLNLPHCLHHMETLFQMRLQVNKVGVIDVLRLGKYNVLALCCIILRNSQMCYLSLCLSLAFLHQSLGSSISQGCNLCQMATHTWADICAVHLYLEIALLPSGSVGSVSSFLLEIFVTPSGITWTDPGKDGKSRRKAEYNYMQF